MEKAILPRNVAQAIERIRERREGERTLFNYPNIALNAPRSEDYSIINTYVNQNEDNFKNYFNALVNGYEIDKNPDEKVRDQYHYYKSHDLHVSANAFEEVLNLLGIRIEGVNA